MTTITREKTNYFHLKEREFLVNFINNFTTENFFSFQQNRMSLTYTKAFYYYYNVKQILKQIIHTEDFKKQTEYKKEELFYIPSRQLLKAIYSQINKEAYMEVTLPPIQFSSKKQPDFSLKLAEQYTAICNLKPIFHKDVYANFNNGYINKEKLHAQYAAIYGLKPSFHHTDTKPKLAFLYWQLFDIVYAPGVENLAQALELYQTTTIIPVEANSIIVLSKLCDFFYTFDQFFNTSCLKTYNNSIDDCFHFGTIKPFIADIERFIQKISKQLSALCQKINIVDKLTCKYLADEIIKLLRTIQLSLNKPLSRTLSKHHQFIATYCHNKKDAEWYNIYCTINLYNLICSMKMEFYNQFIPIGELRNTPKPTEEFMLWLEKYNVLINLELATREFAAFHCVDSINPIIQHDWLEEINHCLKKMGFSKKMKIHNACLRQKWINNLSSDNSIEKLVINKISISHLHANEKNFILLICLYMDGLRIIEENVIYSRIAKKPYSIRIQDILHLISTCNKLANVNDNYMDFYSIFELQKYITFLINTIKKSILRIAQETLATTEVVSTLTKVCNLLTTSAIQDITSNYHFASIIYPVKEESVILQAVHLKLAITNPPTIKQEPIVDYTNQLFTYYLAHLNYLKTLRRLIQLSQDYIIQFNEENISAIGIEFITKEFPPYIETSSSTHIKTFPISTSFNECLAEIRKQAFYLMLDSFIYDDNICDDILFKQLIDWLEQKNKTSSQTDIADFIYHVNLMITYDTDIFSETDFNKMLAYFNSHAFFVNYHFHTFYKIDITLLALPAILNKILFNIRYIQKKEMKNATSKGNKFFNILTRNLRDFGTKQDYQAIFLPPALYERLNIVLPDELKRNNIIKSLILLLSFSQDLEKLISDLPVFSAYHSLPVINSIIQTSQFISTTLLQLSKLSATENLTVNNNLSTKTEKINPCSLAITQGNQVDAVFDLLDTIMNAISNLLNIIKKDFSNPFHRKFDHVIALLNKHYHDFKELIFLNIEENIINRFRNFIDAIDIFTCLNHHLSRSSKCYSYLYTLPTRFNDMLDTYTVNIDSKNNAQVMVILFNIFSQLTNLNDDANPLCPPSNSSNNAHGFFTLKTLGLFEQSTQEKNTIKTLDDGSVKIATTFGHTRHTSLQYSLFYQPPVCAHRKKSNTMPSLSL